MLYADERSSQIYIPGTSHIQLRYSAKLADKQQIGYELLRYTQSISETFKKLLVGTNPYNIYNTRLFRIFYGIMETPTYFTHASELRNTLQVF